MADQSLVIRINGDVKNFNKALEDAKKSTSDLSGTLSSVSQKAGLAWAGLTAAIVANIAAYRTQEQAEIRTHQVLKSTGEAAGITADEVFRLAGAMQEVTTFGDEVTISGQNVLLTFTNISKDIFPRATAAMLDLSQAMGGDVQSNALKLGRALDNPIAGMDLLSRSGVKLTQSQKELVIELQATGKLAQAQGIILGELEKKFGGAAKSAADGTGKFLQLKNIFGDLAEDIGKQLLPPLVKLAQIGIDGIKWVREHPAIARFTANILLLGSAIAGGISVVTGLATAFISFKAAMLAINIATGGLLTTTRLLVGSTGLGLLLIVVADLALNWEKRFAQMQAIYQTFAQNISEIGKGLGEFLVGVFTFNLPLVKKGFDDLKNVVIKSFSELQNDPAFKAAQDNNPYAPDPQKTREKHQENLDEAKKAYDALKEEQLKRLEEDIGIQQTKDEQLLERQILAEQLSGDEDIMAINTKIERAQNAEDKLNAIKERSYLIDQKRRRLVGDEERQAQMNSLKYAEAAANSLSAIGSAIVANSGSNAKKQFLINQALGVAQATINAFIAASMARAQFPGPPYTEPNAQFALHMGLINAASIGAVGMIQYHGMEDGGLVTGGIPGVDSVPILAQQGEIVAPAQNYEEVIGSVRAQREAAKLMKEGQPSEKSNGENELKVTLDIRSDLLRVLEIQRKGEVSAGIRT